MTRSSLVSAGMVATCFLISACSFSLNGKDNDPSNGNGDPNATADGGSSTGDSATPEAGSSTNDGGSGNADASSVSCPATVEITNLPPWHASSEITAACNTNDLGMLASYLTEGTASAYSMAEAAVSASCKSCVFSNAADSRWGVVIWNPSESSGNAILNVGGCYQLQVNGSVSQECGQATYQQSACLHEACPASCNSDGTCTSKAQNECAGTAESSCGSTYTELQSICGDVPSIVNLLCGSGSAG